jgi:hypothetical protein
LSSSRPQASSVVRCRRPPSQPLQCAAIVLTSGLPCSKPSSSSSPTSAGLTATGLVPASPCALRIQRPRRRSSCAWPAAQFPRLEDEVVSTQHPLPTSPPLTRTINSVSVSICRRSSAYLRPPAAISSGHLLPVPGKPLCPFFARPATVVPEWTPLGSGAGKRWGGATGAAGSRFLQLPTGQSAPESGFLRSSSARSSFLRWFVGLLASCAERSR